MNHPFFLKLFPLLGVSALLALPAHARWAERATRANRREISAEEARSSSAAAEVDRRNKLCMRRIRPAMKGPDWDADPTAIPYAMYQVNKRTELPVHIDNEGLDVASDDLFEETVIYLTAHTRWAFNAAEMENLARWLQRGGTLLLDDCYLRGSGFTESKNTEVAKILPGIEGPIFAYADDPVGRDMFGLLYADAPRPETIRERHVWEYFLFDGRPMVFFTMNDDGCAWEVSTPPTASNPIGEGIGHGGDNAFRELSYQWLSSWFLYAMTH
ncbi:MAG: DUF4159 domain-containing protein [Kiritimatiellia bacterium]|jgi:hypothetical protein